MFFRSCFLETACPLARGPLAIQGLRAAAAEGADRRGGETAGRADRKRGEVSGF